MGNADSRLNFRKAVIELTSNKKAVEPADDAFWEQFWAPANVYSAQDVFSLIPADEIRALREDAPNNLATLCYKAVERLVAACEHACGNAGEQSKVLNCCRLLTRLLPYIFEDADWRGYFWSALPADAPSLNTAGGGKTTAGHPTVGGDAPLAKALLGSLCDLLFCPEFTVGSLKKGPETVDDLSSLDSCEYIWAAGVGCVQACPSAAAHDAHRTELLKLLLTGFSEVIYVVPQGDGLTRCANRWVEWVTSSENRHVLPLFTSLLNTVLGYDPVGYGMPYNHLLFADSRAPLVQSCLHVLVAALDHNKPPSDEAGYTDNFFINYLSRIHRDEDFDFMLKGFSRLLNNPLAQSYLPSSTKKIKFYEELLVLFWKCCEYNRKFLFHVLKSSDVLDILVPILYYINDARNDTTKIGLVHMGVFIILLLSGERNFGVRLNKPYTIRVPMDIPMFTGNHADLLIIVFHKLITTGMQRLQNLFDCVLTILVNVSPYVKSLCMMSANKLVHLLEAFSTPWFLYSSPNNHQLVFFLLEIFNNIIQYQFDGNTNLVYTIIRKRQVFYQLANLPSDHAAIAKSLASRQGKPARGGVQVRAPQSPAPAASAAVDAKEPPVPANSAASPSTGPGDGEPEQSQEGSRAAEPAAPGALSASLPQVPNVSSITEKAGTQVCADEMSTSSGDRQRHPSPNHQNSPAAQNVWTPTSDWVHGWKAKLPLQTIMRLLQVLVPQVEKICIDKGLTDESEIIRFLQHGTLVGLLPVPHPILIRKYQANAGTDAWFRQYAWGVIYLRNTDPPVWYDTEVKLFELSRV